MNSSYVYLTKDFLLFEQNVSIGKIQAPEIAKYFMLDISLANLRGKKVEFWWNSGTKDCKLFHFSKEQKFQFWPVLQLCFLQHDPSKSPRPNQKFSPFVMNLIHENLVTRTPNHDNLVTKSYSVANLCKFSRLLAIAESWSPKNEFT